MNSIGVYEAKTHFPELLRRVSRGETFLITRHGLPLARLAPVQENSLDLEKRKRTVEKLKRFRQKHKLKGLSVREMIEEGRKY